jgi:hypothetical protein
MSEKPKPKKPSDCQWPEEWGECTDYIYNPTAAKTATGKEIH